MIMKMVHYLIFFLDCEIRFLPQVSHLFHFKIILSN